MSCHCKRNKTAVTKAETAVARAGTAVTTARNLFPHVLVVVVVKPIKFKSSTTSGPTRILLDSLKHTQARLHSTSKAPKAVGWERREGLEGLPPTTGGARGRVTGFPVRYTRNA